MACLTTKGLGIKLVSILHNLTKGRYELKKNMDNETYHVVLFTCNDIGVYAAIYNIKHKFLRDGLIHLQQVITQINEI